MGLLSDPNVMSGVMHHLATRDLAQAIAISKGTRNAIAEVVRPAIPAPEYVVDSTNMREDRRPALQTPLNVDAMPDYPLHGRAIMGMFVNESDHTKTLLLTLIVNGWEFTDHDDLLWFQKPPRKDTVVLARELYSFLTRRGFNRAANRVVRLMSRLVQEEDKPQLPHDTFTVRVRDPTVLRIRHDLPLVLSKKGDVSKRREVYQRVRVPNPHYTDRNKFIRSVFYRVTHPNPKEKYYKFLRSLPPGVALLAVNMVGNKWDHDVLESFDSAFSEAHYRDSQQYLLELLPQHIKDVFPWLPFAPTPARIKYVKALNRITTSLEDGAATLSPEGFLWPGKYDNAEIDAQWS